MEIRMDEDAALKSFRLGELSCASEYFRVRKKQGWIPGRESGPFVVLGLAVRSWCCPRELAQAGGADCAWWYGAFAL